jgi:hypothetical protein
MASGVPPYLFAGLPTIEAKDNVAETDNADTEKDGQSGKKLERIYREF